MRIGLVSTINCECGISTYSEHLVQHYPKDTIIFGNHLNDLSDTNAIKDYKIIRCWDRKCDLKELEKQIIDSKVDVVHFQHEFGLFQDHESFIRLIKLLSGKGIKVFITLHTVFDSVAKNEKIYDYAPYLSRIIVHQEGAKNELNLYNCAMVPHGSVQVTKKAKEEARKYLHLPQDKKIALSLGFITPTKAALESIGAIDLLKDKHEDLMFVIVGQAVCHNNCYANLEYAVQLFKSISRLKINDKVKIILKYVSESDLDYWAGACDIVIENYHQTFYSTSGISHLVMSYGLPSVSSNSRILNDLNEFRSLKFDMFNVKQMAEQIDQLLINEALRKQISKECLKYSEQTSWLNIAKRHLEIYTGKE